MNIKIFRSLLTFAAASCVILLAARAADSAKTVVIVANDTLRFSVTRIDATPGEPLHIVLRDEGTMPKAVGGHNWILLQLGKDPIAYATAALSAKSEEYQPKALASEVIASTRLIGPGETAEVTFNAPTKPGTYTFLCSCTAHCLAGMRGTLVVK